MSRVSILASLLIMVASLTVAADDDDPVEGLHARIDSLRIEARYADAAESAAELVNLLNNDPETKPTDIADAERLRDHLRTIAGLPASAQRELAEADALTPRILALVREASFDEAIPMTRRQLEVRSRLLGTANVDAVTSLSYIAALLYYTGDYAGATETWRQQLEITKTIYGNEHLMVAAALGDYSLGLQEIGELDRAEHALAESIAMRQRLGAEPKSMSAALNNLGTLLYTRGKLAACEPPLREALHLVRYRSDVEVQRITTAMGNLAVVLNRRGNPDAAADLYEEAMALHLERGSEDQTVLAFLQNNLASARLEQGRLAEADSLTRESLRIRREFLGEDHDDVAISLLLLARILDQRGQHGEAEALYREALDVRRRVRPQGSHEIAAILQEFGVFLQQERRLEEAEALVREALAYYTAVFGDDHPDRAESLLVLGRIRRDRGDLAEARVLLVEACRVNEAVRRQTGTGIERATALTSPWPDMAALQLAAADSEAAWTSVERSLARSLSDLLSEAAARELSDQEKAAEDALRDTLEKLRDELQVLAEAEGDEATGRPREEVRGELLAAESRWAAMQQDLAARYPVSEGVAVSLDRVQQSLPPNAAMVGWLDVEIGGASRAAAWVIRSERPVAWSRLAEVAAASDEIRASLRALYDEETTRAALTLAYDERIRPVMVELEGVDELIVVPSPAMAGVPVEALLDEEDRFLGDRFTLSYAPSATLYTWIRERAPASATGDGSGERTALLVGNPPYRADGGVAALTQVSPELYRSASRGNRDALDQLPPLPGTEAEVRALEGIFPDPTVLLGTEASEQRLDALARSELGWYRVLHFATHGIPDDRRPDLSALVLSQVGLPDPLESVLAGEPVYDGILTAGEIVRDWQLDADLVTLSACETALGKRVAGEGYVGLAYAFYQAGARGQLVGLWQVEDVATALLMQRFYENWVTRGLSKTAALAEAKRWLRALSFDEVQEARLRFDAGGSGVRGTPANVSPTTEWFDEGPYAHPFFWAPFVLLGDPR